MRFSELHRPGTPFALPFSPDDYLWAGPFTLRLPAEAVKLAQGGHGWGHYRRGVGKYLAVLARGLKLAPVALLYHEARGWTMQDGSHRYMALAAAGAATYDAFLGKPKKKKPIDSC